MDNIQWVEKYNVYSTYVGGIIHVQVAWNSGGESGYQVRVAHLTLKKVAKTPDEGKLVAIRFIQNRLRFLFEQEG